ncbi:MAG: alpha-glucosidase, partial [Deinococcus-Thermus bacterium]|nr:alpha-glucosidase [Deinococcota bacterium]
LEVQPLGRPAQTRTWAIVGPDGDVPQGGRDRTDLARFPRPAFEVERDADGLTLSTDALRVRIDLAPLALTVARPDGTELWRDLPTGAHGHLPGAGVTLHWHRDDDEVLYGLGEASGPLDRSRRRVRLRPLDALAYDAETGDPLYKHVPLLITLRPDGRASAVMIDTAAEAVFDLGAEVDNYHGPYRSVRVGEQALDLWFLAGPDLPTLLRRIHDLTGRPPVPPRWTLGYLASTMHYTDAEDPAAAFRGFAEQLREHEIPCTALHLSSGYSLGDDGLRYVFEWNRRRVPDPAGAVQVLRDAGLRTIANLKPALLTSHPSFDDLARRGWLVREPDGDGPYLSRFWGGEGGYLDLSHPDAYRWWMERVRERILEVGIDIAWNDNNEFQIWDEDARTHAGPARGLRPVLTQLMVRASRDAQRAHDPDARDWSLTRSGMLGTWRYAQTWTGDNHTDWTTLRFNVPMGLNLAMSGWTSVGHDVGGFAGPMPDAELLVRWIEHGVGMPRFVIHSWNEDGTVTEPWSHPEVLDEVRTLLRLRERCVPYLATLAHAAATESEAIVRPLAYDFPAWRPGHREDLVHMLGPALLIAPVVEPGATTRPLRLPPGRWLELATGRIHDGDAEVVAQAPLGVPAWFLREGHGVPVVRGEHDADLSATSDLVRGGIPWGAGGGVHWLGLPDRDGRLRGRLHWDDGVTRAHERGAVDVFELDADGDDARVVAHAAASGMGIPVMDLWTPAGDDANEAHPLPPWGARWRARPLEPGLGPDTEAPE